MSALLIDKQAKATQTLLSIGDLAQRTGVATSTLRYYDELGLVRPTGRESGGRRRYDASAVQAVGVIRFLREVGFTLAEISSFLAADEPRSRQEITDRKLVEVIEQQRHLEVAREVLEHGRQCPAGDPMRCSRFWSIIEAHVRGSSLEDSHAGVHVPTARQLGLETEAPRPGGRERGD
jgi:DNA-binding transcriptional MerR regulator